MAAAAPSPPTSAPPAIRYTPENHERAYYKGLFLVADTAGRGQIAGPEAVKFLTRSQLPVATLKSIWTVADQPPSNFLDLPKFAVAVRLIQCMQNGQRGQGTNLATPPGVVMRPPMFEGVSGVQVPLPPEPHTPSPSPPPPLQSPPQQQQQQQPPPHRGSMTQQQQQGGSSRALTAQDPYGMGPSDFSRYEGVFQEYAKEDGFLYGGEAVALFSKSGIPQQALAAIWNMVDSPVDNRLDKIEFALAMHLIVCVSKKSMPLPPALPNSLVQFKQQQRMGQVAAPQPPPPPSAAAQHPPPPSHTAAAAAAASEASRTNEPPAPLATDAAAAAALSANAAAVLAQASQPPPLGAADGGMSISDAFEGLSSEPTTAEMMTPPPEPVAPTMMEPPAPPQPTAPETPAPEPMPQVSATAAVPPQPQVVGGGGMDSSSVPGIAAGAGAVAASASVPAAMSSSSGGTTGSELIQMRELLQKLQAENISLKAQLSGSSEEERDVQKELAITIAEVSRLSSVLTGLRQQVAAQKSKLADLTATLKSAKDNVGLLNSLIVEETATKDALEMANQTMVSATAESAQRGQVQAPEDMFNAPPPPQAGLVGQLPEQPAALSGFDQGSGHQAGMILDTTGPPPPIQEVPSSMEMSPSAQQLDVAAQPAATAPADGPPAQYEYTQPLQAPQIPNSSSEPLVPSNHNRNMSFGFSEGDFMGGAPLPSGSATGIDFSSSAAATAAASQSQPSNLPPPPAPIADFEEMRKKSKEADDIAREAEENSRTLLTKVAELRKAAEDAEAALDKQRRSSEGNQGKKKGLFGGGKQQKKEAKLEQQLALEAKAKKDELLQVQGQANDAQALAMETRMEADQLQRSAEEAEIAQAAANSLKQQQPPPQALAPPPTTNGDSAPPPQQPKTFLPPAHQAQPFGNGNGNDHSDESASFNPNVMSSSSRGFSIPDPTGTSEEFSNPFSS